MIPPHHNYWHRGLYCSRCDNELHTKNKLKLWLWALYHWTKCFGFFGADYTSILLLPRPEIIDMTRRISNGSETEK